MRTIDITVHYGEHVNYLWKYHNGIEIAYTLRQTDGEMVGPIRIIKKKNIIERLGWEEFLSWTKYNLVDEPDYQSSFF